MYLSQVISFIEFGLIRVFGLEVLLVTLLPGQKTGMFSFHQDLS